MIFGLRKLHHSSDIDKGECPGLNISVGKIWKGREMLIGLEFWDEVVGECSVLEMEGGKTRVTICG